MRDSDIFFQTQDVNQTARISRSDFVEGPKGAGVNEYLFAKLTSASYRNGYYRL